MLSVLLDKWLGTMSHEKCVVNIVCLSPFPGSVLTRFIVCCRSAEEGQEWGGDV